MHFIEYVNFRVPFIDGPIVECGSSCLDILNILQSDVQDTVA